jgi:hypothetical protein
VDDRVIGAVGLDLSRGEEGVLAGVDVLAATETCEHLWHDGRVAITFEHWQSISDDTELKAAAAAAFVLGARLERLDIPPVQGMRDFDLVFSDDSREPLEITRYVDRPAYETWERIRRAAPLLALSLTRRWVLAVPHSTPASATTRVPYDVNDFVARIEPALAALEAAGHHTVNLGRLQRDPALAGALQTLLALGVQDAFSHALEPSQMATISLFAPVGGWTNADLIAAAIEREAADAGNQRKLQQPSTAARRHLFVVFDGSSGSFFNAAQRGLIDGRLPTLPPPITTAWAGAGGHVLRTTPPDAWSLHPLPDEVFTAPERWLI